MTDKSELDYITITGYRTGKADKSSWIGTIRFKGNWDGGIPYTNCSCQSTLNHLPINIIDFTCYRQRVCRHTQVRHHSYFRQLVRYLLGCQLDLMHSCIIITLKWEFNGITIFSYRTSKADKSSRIGTIHFKGNWDGDISYANCSCQSTLDHLFPLVIDFTRYCQRVCRRSQICSSIQSCIPINNYWRRQDNRTAASLTSWIRYQCRQFGTCLSQKRNPITQFQTITAISCSYCRLWNLAPFDWNFHGQTSRAADLSTITVNNPLHIQQFGGGTKVGYNIQILYFASTHFCSNYSMRFFENGAVGIGQLYF